MFAFFKGLTVAMNNLKSGETNDLEQECCHRLRIIPSGHIQVLLGAFSSTLAKGQYCDSFF